MEQFFQLKNHNTTIKTELVAGIISFITVVYIVIVNATILSQSGMPFNAALYGTILTCFFGSVVMGLFSNSPIILVPGMGINAMFTYTIVQNGGFSWQEALAIVFCAGVLFTLIAFTPLAKKIVSAIPHSLKEGISVGIGLLLIFIGLEQSGIIISSQDTLLALGDLTNTATLLTLFGVIVTFVLFTRNIPCSLLISMVIITIVSILFGTVDLQNFSWQIPSPKEYGSVFGAMSFQRVFSFGFLLTSFSLAMVIVFENIGLVHGQTKLLKQPEKFNRSLKATAISVLSCGLLGSSPTVAVVEGTAGMTAGGRTGLTSITTGLLFLSSIFFIPIIKVIPTAAISPILILIGALMLQNIKNINLQDLSEAFPAILIIVLIPFTFSIANGMAIGFIAYPLCKIFLGKYREVQAPLYIIATLFFINFIIQFSI